MERHGRGKGKHRLLGNHQKCWLWGRNVILETLSAGRWRIHDLHVSSELPEAARAQVAQLASQTGTPLVVEEPEALERLSHTSEHQGYVARMTEYPYADEAGMLSAAGKTPAFAVLDGVQDPHNLGAIARSAEVFGLDGLFLGAVGQAGVGSMVARSSAGAVNRIPMARIDDLAALATRLVAHGICLVAASEKATQPLMQCDLTRPVSIVIGNEGTGISPAVLDLCRHRVAIPQCGHIGSLNAAVAASIFFYELRRQRGAAG